jgi:protocatechuate 3,4-dioxygenase beta subunit
MRVKNSGFSTKSLVFSIFLLGPVWPVIADEPVIGGPCEGCELVFVGMPGELASEARIAPPEEPGEAMRIEGTVTSADGRPAPGIVIYAYHTDAAGVYPRAETRHGRLRGWARADGQGRYAFKTIRPGAYPGRSIPQHVHMHVIEPGHSTYWIASIEFEDDPLFSNRSTRDSTKRRGGNGLVAPIRDVEGGWLVRRDIVLGLHVPGYRTSP